MSPTTGRIAGAIGLVTLLGSVYTYFVVIAVPWFAGAQALVGAALIAVYFASNYAQLGQFASSRSSFFMVSAALMTVLVTGALVAVNYIAAKRDKSWDLTNKKIYSLAPQTVTTLQGLKDKVTAIGFMQSTHPAYDSLQNLFERYHREAPDKFEFSFKDPRKSPDLALKYQVKEGQATVVVLRGEGEKESHTALNIVSEQELTNALIKTLAGRMRASAAAEMKELAGG